MIFFNYKQNKASNEMEKIPEYTLIHFARLWKLSYVFHKFSQNIYFHITCIVLNMKSESCVEVLYLIVSTVSEHRVQIRQLDNSNYQMHIYLPI